MSLLTFFISVYNTWASQVALEVKNPPAKAGDIMRGGFNTWVGKIPWRRAWQPTPIFLSEKIPWTEEPGGLQSRRVTKSRTRLSRNTMSVSYIYHVAHYIPRTNLSYNWKFLPFSFIQIFLPYLPTSGNHKSDLLFEVQFFFFIIFEV